MSFNVQLEVGQSSECILEWINIERYQKGKQGCLFTFKQVIQESFLYEMLKNIDEVFFLQFQNLLQNAKMDLLEKYLDREFGKRMKWVFKQSLGNFTQQNHIKQFTKLICYLSIHSKKKNQIIGRILTLGEKTQDFLMQQMKKVEQKLQNIMQIKEILEQMQQLQCQNQQYKKQLQQMNKTNTQLLQIIKDCEQQNKKYKDQVQKLRKQKCQVFYTLKIDYITEYLHAYNKIKQENQRYLYLLNQSEINIQEIQYINKQLNQRIKCDCIVINNLSQQITRLKQISNQSLSRNDYDCQRSASKNVLKSTTRSNNKENISKCSTFLGKSLQAPIDWANILLDNDDQGHDKSYYKLHNHDLMGKLENMYGKYNLLNDEIVLLRQKNKEMKIKNRQLKKILKSIKNLYQQFQFKYNVTDKQSQKTINRLIRTIQ